MVNPRQLPELLSPPAPWEIPPGVVVRKGKVGGLEVVAFTDRYGQNAFGVMSRVLREDAPLPDWVWKKFSPILAIF